MTGVSARLRMLRKPAYERNVAILKDYGGRKYKLIRSSCVRTKGIELPKDNYTPKGTVNDSKLANNISRSKSKVYEYAMCNDFTLFCTLTIDQKKVGDRYSLKAYHRALAQWIRDYNKKYDCHIRFLLIPEQHKDGAWHMHGLMMGLPLEHLTPFALAEKLPPYIRGKLKKGEMVYNWLPYAKKFGYVDIEPLRSREAAAKYITKYITKDMARSVSELGAHLYYSSQGLATAKTLKRGNMACDLAPDYEGDYCKVNWFDGSEDVDRLKSLVVTE